MIDPGITPILYGNPYAEMTGARQSSPPKSLAGRYVESPLELLRLMRSAGAERT
jgi:hypothetical protein